MIKELDKDKIKNSLSIDQIFDLVSELGGEPIMNQDYFVCQTLCHNYPGEGSHKLYYYDNTKLFHCYTECEPPTFDIFELICKIKNLAQEYKIKYTKEGKEEYRIWVLYDAIQFVLAYFGIEVKNENFLQKRIELQDWSLLNKYEANNLKNQNQIINLHVYEKGEKILNNLPRPRLKEWENEGISDEVVAAANICYDPHSNSIIIPHYDINDNLIGIRKRTLIKEEEQYGKYKPAILNGIMYNHPLGFNLYNINNSKEHIKQFKKVFIFESEKSCLKYASYFGMNNDISVAICGNSLSNYQVSLLLSLEVKEIIIALDKEYETDNGEDWAKWTKKFIQFFNKYGNYVGISFLVDRHHLLEKKDSPIDKGKQVFLQLYNQREFI